MRTGESLKPSRPVTLVAVATAFSLLGDQLLYSVLPTCYSDLGLMPFQVGLLLSANRWIRLFTNHLAERLCRRLSPGLLLTAALTLGALLTALYALKPSFTVLLIGRALWGLCWSFIRQIGLMTVVDSVVESHAGRWMGFYSGISRIGSIAGNLLGAVGYDQIGFANTLLIFAAVSLCAVPLGGWSRRGLQRVDHSTEVGWSGHGARKGLLFCGFVVGCVGPGLMMSTLGLILRDRVGDGISVGGVAIGVATLTGLLLASRWVADLAAPALGAVADGVGRRRGASGFLFLGAGILALAAIVDAAAPLVVLIVVFFVCATGATVSLVAQAGMAGPRSVARYVTASDLGSAVGPLLGWMAPQWGWPSEVAFAAAAALYVVAAITVLRVRERQPLDAEYVQPSIGRDACGSGSRNAL
jgi:MFS family permease